MSLLISDALAATGGPAGQGGQGDMMSMILFMVMIFVLFYFMLIRPQQKKLKEQRDMLGKLKVGDEIVTTGGILAKISHLDEHYIKAQLADSIEIVVQRSAVSHVLPKGTLKSI